MAPQMATTVSVVSILLLIFQVGVKAQTACSAAMQKIMLVPECSQLQTSVGKVAGKLAGASCEVVAATAKEVYGENVPSNCCPGVRAMVEAGCSCDPNFRLLLATVNGFATTEKAADVINGSEDTLGPTSLHNRTHCQFCMATWFSSWDVLLLEACGKERVTDPWTHVSQASIVACNVSHFYLVGATTDPILNPPELLAQVHKEISQAVVVAKDQFR
eukprot:jgi/Botrbrau1/19304/Bobra.0073s0045.1